MPGFAELNDQIAAAQDAVVAREREFFLAGQGVRRIESKKQSLGRGAGLESREGARLIAAEQKLRQEQAESGKRLEAAKALRNALLDQFDHFSDPRSELGRLGAHAPILMLPVRLETRFKQVSVRGITRYQLWVRIFPDDCSIDGFDDVLSSSEIERAKNYWVSVYRAGRADGSDQSLGEWINGKKVAAFRKLMGSFNAGRAHYVREHHAPLEPSELPMRTSSEDVLLVIPCVDLPDDAARAALSTYYQRVLLAPGDRAAVEAEFTALATALELDSAASLALLDTYRPSEWQTLLESGPTTGSASVTFLLFEKDPEQKVTAWSQASRVRTFPERFLLLGYGPANSAPVISQLGGRVPDPLIVGPDAREEVSDILREELGDELDTLTDEQKAAKYVEYLAQRSETRWLFDFDSAVDSGLGFRVDLSKEQYEAGFSRLFVVGVKLGADSNRGQALLEELLLHHQFGDSGFSFLRQGTPTNNTESTPSGHSLREEAEEADARYRGPSTVIDPASDGRIFARLLGIDATRAGLQTAKDFDTRDQVEARAMHTALWSATLGYFFESMLPAVATEEVRHQLREHLRQFVRGRGSVPALRIGKQPYGILPTADLKRLDWVEGRTPLLSVSRGQRSLLSNMHRAALVMWDDMQDVLRRVAHVHGGEGDAHRKVLGVLGLHPSSVEFDRRLAQSFLSLKHYFLAQGESAPQVDEVDADYFSKGLTLLRRLGYSEEAVDRDSLDLFTKYFLGDAEDLDKPPIDDTPLSETRAIRSYTDAGENYIEWLIRNAEESHRAIRNETGFTDNKRPLTILYDMLRHALNLEFAGAGLNLHAEAQKIDVKEAQSARIDRTFIGIQGQDATLQSKWDITYRMEPAISKDRTVAEHISANLGQRLSPATQQLEEMLDALRILARLPTARLERCFVEHLDCSSYRLDAWLLSFVQARLHSLRTPLGGEGQGARTGLYLGAFGWVENLRPEGRKLADVDLSPEERKTFGLGADEPVYSDSKNAGYVQAPSLTQGLTTAILRNAYRTYASAEDRQRYQVNLSSERVRTALSIIEGIQQGQGLSELLGYQLERGLHDANTLELDLFIYDLRKVFSLQANRLRTTAIKKGRAPKNALEAARHPEEDAELTGDLSVTKVEAKNVVDGLALLDQIKRTGVATYPFGIELGEGAHQLRPASTDEANAINAEVQRLMSARDAVADLAIAECVHQVVQGNYERAAGTLDTYSKGGFPQLPEVAQSSTGGTGLTHRFTIHLPTSITLAQTSPRALTEPAMNQWLGEILPPTNRTFCNVRFRRPAEGPNPAGAYADFPVALADLGLDPIDALYLFDHGSDASLSAFDDFVVTRFLSVARPPHLELRIDYMDGRGGVSFFELSALLSDLRTLLLGSRPLEPSDLAPPTEGSRSKNAALVYDDARLAGAKSEFDAALQDLGTLYLDLVRPLIQIEDIDATVQQFPAMLGLYEATLPSFKNLLFRLSRFGLQGASTLFLLERGRSIYLAVFGALRAQRNAWTDALARSVDLTNATLPATPVEEERVKVLQDAEALVSVTYTTLFADSAELLVAVQAKQALLRQKRDDFDGFLSSEFPSLEALFLAADAVLTGLEDFNHQPLDLAPQKRLFVVLVVDMFKQAEALWHLGTKKAVLAQDAIAALATAPAGAQQKAATAAAVALFGDGFVMIPRFQLTTEQALEVGNCLSSQAQLLSYQTTELGHDHPVDEWLYGVARVRDKLAAWENVTILSEGLRPGTVMDLVPLQLPHRDGNRWLGMPFPADQSLDGDHLLYTAYAPGFDPSRPLAGIMVDEWTETIPSRTRDTALAFHYDRPNNEPAQSMLLVTPATLGASWSFDELVSNLHQALDLARLRALEPDLINETAYARLLPATIAALTFHPVTIALDYASRKFSQEALG